MTNFRSSMGLSSPIRVLLVDDSAVMRRLLMGVFETEADIEIVGTANNGRMALERLEALKPDIMVLDVEMPVLDGLGTLKELRPHWPRLPVIMFSSLTEKGAAATLDALALGATDYVTKPSHVSNREEAEAVVRVQLVPLIRSWGAISRTRRDGAVPSRNAAPLAPTSTEVVQPPIQLKPPREAIPPKAVVIGSSTGGPNALSELIPILPGGLQVPIFIVQHMPPLFTKLLAERLDQRSSLSVVEAQPGMTARAGQVYVAPGGVHLVVRSRAGEVIVDSDDGPPENSVKPSVDVLFRSAVEVWGGALLGVVLTGMGQDGLLGARKIVSAGGRVVVQDEATSVVWGMPGAIAKENIATEVLPLQEIGLAITRYVGQPVLGRHS
ncbi:MAG: chemotaxis response regulator protein-glutamate methylesterase [Actinobacteria bacterium]|nr:chemotaxis response regulator protein-glutamate methylesterase [Actinomycetota bacterium]MCL6094593.1 chemotaxis response regulator protein-glutamate methylesterase [Actinomycetota bacterium]